MNIVKVLVDRQFKQLTIGKQGENKATSVQFNVKPWLDMWPGATIALAVQPPTGDAYPAVVTTADGITTWVITSADTAVPGTGKCELRVLLNDVVKKSATYITFVAESFTASGEAPDPVTDWIEDAQAKLGEVDNAVDLIENMTVSAAASETPSATLTEVDGHYNIAFGLVKGDKGDQGVQGIQGPAGADGAPGQDGAPGADGRDGQDGAPGADGYSPTASVSKSNGVATITITDKNGTTTAQVSDGATGQTGPAGADGYSPTATVTKSGDTATISITDKNGTTTATVTDGSPGPGVPAGGTTGQMLVKKSDSDYDGEWANQPSVPVQDVQVNGTSILNAQGVANVPVATQVSGEIQSSIGLLYARNGYDGVMVRPEHPGRLTLNPTSSAQIKAGNDGYLAVTTARQHEATFFGLAKASGDSTQASSSNPVGTYTESAKSAISQMLDAPETVSGTTPSITAKAGVRYVCGECATLTIVAPASGCIDVTFTSGSTATVLTVSSAKTGVTAIKWANGFDPTSLEANTVYEINILDGEFGVVGSWT